MTTVKLTKNADLAAFLRTVNNCSGEVFFSTDQGDHLNLKSMLSQYLFSVAAGDRALLLNGEVSCEDERDRAMLRPYFAVEQGE